MSYTNEEPATNYSENELNVNLKLREESIVNLLEKIKKNEDYLLFLIKEQTDEQYEEMELFLENEDVNTLLQILTYDDKLYKNDIVIEYFDLECEEYKDYLHQNILMLLYYMSDNNENDTKYVDEDTKNNCKNSIQLFKNILNYPDDMFLIDESYSSINFMDRVNLFKESLNISVPLCCQHIVNSSKNFSESNFYQEMMSHMLGMSSNEEKLTELFNELLLIKKNNENNEENQQVNENNEMNTVINELIENSHYNL